MLGKKEEGCMTEMIGGFVKGNGWALAWWINSWVLQDAKTEWSPYKLEFFCSQEYNLIGHKGENFLCNSFSSYFSFPNIDAC